MRKNPIDAVKLVLLRLLIMTDAAARRLWPRKRKESTILEGNVARSSGSTLCIFAHYDRDGIIDDYVIHYLEALAKLGCETVFVSTAPGLDADRIQRIRPLTSRIILRQNRGYDFGSWRDGLATCGDLTRYDRLVIANDSVYGPIRDLGEVLQTMRERGALAWGITDSWRYVRHLQSYFLVFERPVLESEAFQGFWRNLPDYRFKHSVIIEGEVGLPKVLVHAGFELAAVCEYEEMAKDMFSTVNSGLSINLPKAPLNATLWNWEVLILDHACPFIKVQLLRDNPKGLGNIGEWQAALESVSDYDASLIRRHLERMTERS